MVIAYQMFDIPQSVMKLYLREFVVVIILYMTILLYVLHLPNFYYGLISLFSTQKEFMRLATSIF